MSYILDALKKEAADNDPVAASKLALAATSTPRNWVLWIVVAALVLNIIALAVLFGPQLWRSEAGRSATTTPLTQPAARRELTVTPRNRTAPPPAQPTPRTPRPSSPPSTPAPVPEPAAVASDGTGSSTSSGGRVLSPAEAAALNLIPAEAAGGETVIAPTAPAEEPGETVAAGGNTTEARPAAAGRPKVIQLAELPPADRQDFPKLEFSTHIFADDPALRAVVVNSRRLAEGESIGEMVLRAVTEDGILVDYRGYRVAVSVIEDWE